MGMAFLMEVGKGEVNLLFSFDVASSLCSQSC